MNINHSFKKYGRKGMKRMEEEKEPKRAKQ